MAKPFLLVEKCYGQVASLAQEAWRGAGANGTTVAPCGPAKQRLRKFEDETMLYVYIYIIYIYNHIVR